MGARRLALLTLLMLAAAPAFGQQTASQETLKP